jgi:hypothetical protein
VLNYRRKAGRLVKGSFTIASSVSCDDPFVSSLVVENLKDRAITIFEIYLKVGSNCYIEIEDFGSKPLVLRAYETYQNEYGPVEFYSMNMKRVALREVLSDERRAKKRLVLSTSDGKYVVSSEIRRWRPVYAYFRNYLTLDLRPVRRVYKEKYIGGNVKFVIEFLNEDGHEEIVPVHANDWRLKLFKRFQLSEEALMTKETLEAFLEQQVDEGKLTCKKYTVLDMQEWRAKARSDYSPDIVEARVYSLFWYHVLGRMATIYRNRRLKR